MNKNCSFIGIIILIFSLHLNLFGQKVDDKDVILNVKFQVISQRLLTKDEQRELPEFNSVVRVCLINNSKQDIYIVVSNTGESLRIRPLGFYYSRKLGEKEWKKQMRNNTFSGFAYRNVIISPNMSIEYDIASANIKDRERMYSLSLSQEKNGRLFEIFTDSILPIVE